MRATIVSFILYFIITTPPDVHAARPVVTSFSPASGPVGTLVTVNGINLSNPTSVIVGGKAAIVISSTATKLVVMVMPGAVTGAESITTSGGILNTSGNFKVTATPYPGKQQGGTIQGAGSIGAARQGSSIDLSADGNTAIIGAENDDNGKGGAFIYTRKNGVWSQQGQKLLGAGAAGAVHQGFSVAINADGNIAVLGSKTEGSLWIFNRANGLWVQQGAKLTVANAIGYSLDMSADGNTIVSGVPGAALVFSRTNGIWAAPQDLISTDIFPPDPEYDAQPGLGTSVAISADGNTIAAGAPHYGSGYFFGGAVGIFVRNGNTWTQQGPKLTEIGASFEPGLGSGVALSADGNTLVAGGSVSPYEVGAVWVFIRTNTTWAQKGRELTNKDWYLSGYTNLGASVAVSADGKTIAAGGPSAGAAGGTVVFTYKDNAWIMQSGYLTKADGSGTPTSQAVALSATGNTLITGLPNNFDSVGGAQVFIPFPAKQDQQITFAAPKATFTYGEPDFAFTALSNSGLPLSIYSDATDLPDVVIEVVNGKMHIKRAGTVTFTAMQAGNDNYNAASPVSITLTVKKAPLTVKINDFFGMQGSRLPVFTATYTGVVNGDTGPFCNLVSTATRISAPGVYPITGIQASNKYEATFIPGKLTMFSPEFVNAPVNKTYGDPDFYIFGNYAPGVTIQNSPLLTTVNGKTHITAAGEDNLFFFYTGVTLTKATVVSKAMLTITADNKTKTAGSPNPALTVNYNGFMYADNQNSLITQPAVTTTATLSSPAGTYPIIVSGAVSGNYKFSYIAGTLTITGPITGAANQPVVYKAISPNGDGINDVLTISGTENFAGNKLTLMNSKGVKVYEAENYGSEGKLFNGRSNITNTLQTAGTYFYLLQYNDNGVIKHQKGYVVLKY